MLKEVLESFGNSYKQRYRMGKFQCDCGNTAELKITKVMNGEIRSCGCKAKYRHTYKDFIKMCHEIAAENPL